METDPRQSPSAGGAESPAAPTARPYRGRFAPSPTGPLHFGSLVTAVGSYLAARRAGGQWLVRIENLDPPREAPGSAEAIVTALGALGFEWTGSIVRQSERSEAYRSAVTTLLAQGLAFPCSCSRSELHAARAPTACVSARSDVRDYADGDELYYPGWCRNGVRAPERPLAIRLRVPSGTIAFHDELQGAQAFDVSTSVGDFVIRRRDGLYAYQLAVIVDDAEQRITHVARGADLLISTPRQILLQRALCLPTPMYAHLPLVTDANGVKLSKSKQAAAVNVHQPARELWRALRFLRQAPPPELRLASVATVWEWAIENWCVQPLQGLRHAPIEEA